MLKIARYWFYLAMRKKGMGIVLLIFGSYFVLINPILSMLFFRVYTIGFYVPIDPFSYWIEWLFMYGYIIVMFALLGVCLIILGYRFISEAAEARLKSSG